MSVFARWIYEETDGEEVRKLANKAGISRLTASILYKRGISDVRAVNKFFNPDLSDLHDPFLMDGMDAAVERIARALRNGEKVIIHGDYDVDGITAASMLYNYLSSAGSSVDFYVPDRLSEGYGISDEGVRYIVESGATLAITVDCGISAIDEVKAIRDSGIDVIVTDHHQCQDIIPNASAVLNPCKADDSYPFKELSGAGVVFKLLQALSAKTGRGDFMHYLDLAALGTVADVVPLLDENRVIARYGIEAIANTGNVGLKALLEVAGISEKPLDSWHLGFIIGPRVNASGRLSDASKAVRLFTCNSYEEAYAIARELDDENARRKEIEKFIFDRAMEQIEGEGFDDDRVVLVSGQEWHRGVIGIVASRITECLKKPAIVVSLEDGEATGSARSVEGFNIYEALNKCRHLFYRFGGHKVGPGFTTSREAVDKLRKALRDMPLDSCGEEALVPSIRVDGFIGGDDDLCLEMVSELEKMRPFGPGNPAPVIGGLGMKVLEERTVGEGKHLKLLLDCNGLPVDAIGFNMGDINGHNAGTVDAVFRVQINTWRGMDMVQLNLLDLRPSPWAISEEMYYESLCNCLEYFSWEGGGAEPDDNCENLYHVVDMIKRDCPDASRVIFLVNGLEELYQVTDYLNKTYIGIKKRCKICYNVLDKQEDVALAVLVNPVPGMFPADRFDTVVIFGSWLDAGYYERIKEENGRRNKTIYFTGAGRITADGIIPERDELVVLYRYLKNNASPVRFDDMFSGVREFSSHTGMKSNPFKLKVSLEIFKELELADIRNSDGRGVEVLIRENSGEKRDLMESRIYKSLQYLKYRSAKPESKSG